VCEDESLFLVFGTILFAAFFLPFVLLVAPQTGRAAAEVLAIYALRMLYAARYRSSWLGAALHPIGLMFAMLIGLNGWRRSAGPAGVRWKTRTYKVVHSSST
jgi:cell division protein FtsW (lipid II flippase)